MTKIPDNVKKSISAQDVFPVATSTSDGVPNIIYIRYLKVVDDNTILMADNYFNKTRDNIVNNGKIAFVVLKEDKGSFQLKGTAKRVTEGPMFDELQRWVPDKYPRVAAVVMHVDQIYCGADLVE